MPTNAATRVDDPDPRPAPGDGEWSGLYARFLSDSVASAQKTLRLYQQTLECVAAGRLPATVFQEYYPRFVQRHGPAYAERLAEVFAAFMGRLAELGKHNASHADDGAAAVVAPTFDAATPERWFEQYAEYAGKLNAGALRAYRKELDQVANGDRSPEEVQQKVAEDMSRRLPGFLREAGQLYLRLLHDLAELRGDFEDAYLGGILSLAEESAKDVVTSVALQAPLGGTASRSFTITNTTAARMPVAYVATEVRRMDGVGPAFAPKVAIAPENLELEPGQEASVTFSIQLDADQYEPELPYIGFLYVTGDDGRRVELQLRIVATAAVAKKDD